MSALLDAVPLATDSGSLLGQAFDRIPVPIVIVSGEGLIAMVNAQAEAIFGYSRGEMQGKAVEMLVPERFRRGHVGYRNGFFASPDARAMGAGRDLYARRKDGSEFPVEIGLNPIQTDQGPMVLSAIVDISERKRAEGAIRESEERFRMMVEGVTDYSILMLDPRGHIASWNAGALRMKGYEREQIVGQHFSRFYLEDDVRDGKPDRDLAHAMAAGRFEGEGWRTRADGSRFWANVVITAMRDAAGNLYGFSKMTRDLTQRIEAEERFQLVVEAAPTGMVMVDREGKILLVNAQIEKLFGHPRAMLLGQPIEMLVPVRLRLQHPHHRLGYFASPAPRAMGEGRDLYGLRSDGSEFPVEIGLNPIETAEGKMVMASIIDITDRKQREDRIRAALDEKELLLGEIHHRVKNNLQIINSLLDLQAMRVDDVGMKGMLRDSQNRVRSMSMIHQTLYQSHDFADVDFQHFLQSLVPTLLESYGADASRIALLIDAHQVRLPINSAIPCGLIINELVTNALKHGLSGGRAGQVRVELTRDGAADAVLSVSNTGVDVAADLDFSRAATLGMQLVTLLTRQIGGTLTVRRADPVRFEVRFPLGG